MVKPLRILPACTALVLLVACSAKTAKAPTPTAPLPTAPLLGSTVAGATPVGPAPRLAQALGQPVDGIPCETSERLTYHVHAHLAVIANAQPVLVPANIGIPGQCIYWLHTHDTTGIVHVEAPSQREFTLGNFFDIWGQPLSATQVLGFSADASHQLEFFVDGKQYTGDPRQIALAAHSQIVVEYGPPFPPPPNYSFPAGY